MISDAYERPARLRGRTQGRPGSARTVSLYELHERPALEAPVLVMTLEAGSTPAPVGPTPPPIFWRRSPHGARNLRHRCAAGLPGPPARHAHRGRGEHAPRLDRDPAAGSQGRRRQGPPAARGGRARSRLAGVLRRGRGSRDFGARMLVGLGAYPAAAPHTRPVRLACTATTEAVPRSPVRSGNARRPGRCTRRHRARGGRRRYPRRRPLGAGPHYAAAMPYRGPARPSSTGWADWRASTSTPPACTRRPRRPAPAWARWSPKATSTKSWSVSSRRTPTPSRRGPTRTPPRAPVRRRAGRRARALPPRAGRVVRPATQPGRDSPEPPRRVVAPRRERPSSRGRRLPAARWATRPGGTARRLRRTGTCPGPRRPARPGPWPRVPPEDGGVVDADVSVSGHTPRSPKDSVGWVRGDSPSVIARGGRGEHRLVEALRRDVGPSVLERRVEEVQVGNEHEHLVIGGRVLPVYHWCRK